MKMRITMTLCSTIINNTKQQALTEGSEQVAEQTCLSSVWQSPCNRRGHWDSERRWVRICLADPKSAFLWSATTRHSNSKIPLTISDWVPRHVHSWDSLYVSEFLPAFFPVTKPRTTFMHLLHLRPQWQHLQIYPSSQSTKTVSSKTAQRGKAMAATPGGLSSCLGAHKRKKRANRMLQIGLSLTHALCMIHTHAQEERKQINTYKRSLCNSEDKRTEKVYQHVSKMWSL